MTLDSPKHPTVAYYADRYDPRPENNSPTSTDAHYLHSHSPTNSLGEFSPLLIIRALDTAFYVNSRKKTHIFHFSRCYSFTTPTNSAHSHHHSNHPRHTPPSLDYTSKTHRDDLQNLDASSTNSPTLLNISFSS